MMKPVVQIARDSQQRTNIYLDADLVTELFRSLIEQAQTAMGRTFINTKTE